MYSTYFSQFVHGLSIGILPGNDQFENFDALMSVGICLQGIVLDELKKRFNQESALLNNVTFDDFTSIASQLSEDFLIKLNASNSKVQDVIPFTDYMGKSLNFYYFDLINQ